MMSKFHLEVEEEQQQQKKVLGPKNTEAQINLLFSLSGHLLWHIFLLTWWFHRKYKY